MECQREGGRKEQAHRNHVRGVVVKVQELVPNVGHPVEVAQDAVGKPVPPGSQEQGTNDHQGHIGEDGHTKSHGNVISHAEFAADFHFAQGP